MTTMDSFELMLTVDQYIEQLCVPDEEVFAQALRDAAAADLPEIHVSPNEGKLLYLLAKLSGAQRILEIGLLGGYSALWFARALPPDGKLVTLEVNEHHARVARKNLERAGVMAQVDIRVGPALTALQQMCDAREKPFDLVFIDADKESYPAYLDWAVRLTRPGGLILADNVIRDGAVAQEGQTDPIVRATQQFNRQLAGHPALDTILVPLMRRKLDGLAIARVKDRP
jgi:predicted O-methyltransferase YrrM